MKLSIILVLGLIISAVNITANPGGPGDSGLSSGINVEKSVANVLGSSIGENVAEIGDVLTFRIIVKNFEPTPLDIQVIDEMPVSFEYLETIEPKNPDDFLCAFNGYTTLIWDFSEVGPGETIRIIYKAEVVRCGELINTVNVEGSYTDRETGLENVITAEDSVVIHVSCNSGMEVQKYVKLDGDEQYLSLIHI